MSSAIVAPSEIKIIAPQLDTLSSAASTQHAKPTSCNPQSSTVALPNAATSAGGGGGGLSEMDLDRLLQARRQSRLERRRRGGTTLMETQPIPEDSPRSIVTSTPSASSSIRAAAAAAADATVPQSRAPSNAHDRQQDVKLTESLPQPQQQQPRSTAHLRRRAVIVRPSSDQQPVTAPTSSAPAIVVLSVAPTSTSSPPPEHSSASNRPVQHESLPPPTTTTAETSNSVKSDNLPVSVAENQDPISSLLSRRKITWDAILSAMKQTKKFSPPQQTSAQAQRLDQIIVDPPSSLLSPIQNSVPTTSTSEQISKDSVSSDADVPPPSTISASPFPPSSDQNQIESVPMPPNVLNSADFVTDVASNKNNSPEQQQPEHLEIPIELSISSLPKSEPEEDSDAQIIKSLSPDLEQAQQPIDGSIDQSDQPLTEILQSAQAEPFDAANNHVVQQDVGDSPVDENLVPEMAGADDAEEKAAIENIESKMSSKQNLIVDQLATVLALIGDEEPSADDYSADEEDDIAPINAPHFSETDLMAIQTRDFLQNVDRDGTTIQATDSIESIHDINEESQQSVPLQDISTPVEQHPQHADNKTVQFEPDTPVMAPEEQRSDMINADIEKPAEIQPTDGKLSQTTQSIPMDDVHIQVDDEHEKNHEKNDEQIADEQGLFLSRIASEDQQGSSDDEQIDDNEEGKKNSEADEEEGREGHEDDDQEESSSPSSPRHGSSSRPGASAGGMSWQEKIALAKNLSLAPTPTAADGSASAASASGGRSKDNRNIKITPGSGLSGWKDDTEQAPEDYNRVIQEGYLMKEGHKIKNWKKRYVVVRKWSLSYFESEDDAHHHPDEPIHNINIRNCLCVPAPEKDRQYCFKVLVEQRTFFLSAESARERKLWVDSILKAGAFQINERKIKKMDRPMKALSEVGLELLTNPSDNEELRFALEGLIVFLQEEDATDGLKELIVKRIGINHCINIITSTKYPNTKEKRFFTEKGLTLLNLIIAGDSEDRYRLLTRKYGGVEITLKLLNLYCQKKFDNVMSTQCVELLNSLLENPSKDIYNKFVRLHGLDEIIKQIRLFHEMCTHEKRRLRKFEKGAAGNIFDSVGEDRKRKQNSSLRRISMALREPLGFRHGSSPPSSPISSPNPAAAGSTSPESNLTSAGNQLHNRLTEMVGTLTSSSYNAFMLHCLSIFASLCQFSDFVPNIIAATSVWSTVSCYIYSGEQLIPVPIVSRAGPTGPQHRAGSPAMVLQSNPYKSDIMKKLNELLAFCSESDEELVLRTFSKEGLFRALLLVYTNIESNQQPRLPQSSGQPLTLGSSSNANSASGLSFEREEDLTKFYVSKIFGTTLRHEVVQAEVMEQLHWYHFTQDRESAKAVMKLVDFVDPDGLLRERIEIELPKLLEPREQTQ